MLLCTFYGRGNNAAPSWNEFSLANNMCSPGACEEEARMPGRARKVWQRRLMGEKRAGLPLFRRRWVKVRQQQNRGLFPLANVQTLIECVGWWQIANCELKITSVGLCVDCEQDWQISRLWNQVWGVVSRAQEVASQLTSLSSATPEQVKLLPRN